MGDGRFGAWITWITNLIFDNSKSWMVSLQLLAWFNWNGLKKNITALRDLLKASIDQVLWVPVESPQWMKGSLANQSHGQCWLVMDSIVIDGIDGVQYCYRISSTSNCELFDHNQLQRTSRRSNRFAQAFRNNPFSIPTYAHVYKSIQMKQSSREANTQVNRMTRWGLPGSGGLQPLGSKILVNINNGVFLIEQLHSKSLFCNCFPWRQLLQSSFSGILNRLGCL